MARLSFQMTDHQMKRFSRHGIWRGIGPGISSHVQMACFDDADLSRSTAPQFQEKDAAIPTGKQRVFDQDSRITQRSGAGMSMCLERHRLTAGEQQRDLILLHIDYENQGWADLAPQLLPLQRDLGLVFAPETVVQAGYRLAQGQALALGVRGQAPILTPNMDIHHGLAAILRGCMAQWLANHAGVAQAGAVEAIHQMRVALRRLRAALSLFRTIITPVDDPDLAADLRQLAVILGHVRDRDVFLAEIVPLAAHAIIPTDHDALMVELAEQRQIAWQQAASAVLDGQHLALVVRVERWLEQLMAHPAGRAISDLAPDLLDKRLKRVRRLGRDLENRSPEERHELRIALKKLRYSLEFFGVLYDERRLSKKLAHLVELQQILGLLNDVATAHRLVGELHGAATAARAGGIVVGWSQRDSEQKLRHLVRAWDDFCDLKPFWRRPLKS